MISKPLSSFFPIDQKEDVAISHLTLDSRDVKPGTLFFAIPGDQFDGRKYIEQAIEKGAVAILYENADGYEFKSHPKNTRLIAYPHLRPLVGPLAAEFYNHPTQKLNVAGATGTNGKTSITHFIAQAYQSLAEPAAVIGTLGYGILPHLDKTGLTTPCPVHLQRIFAELLKQGVKHIAMEVSSHALAQKRVNGVRFKTAAFTQLTQDHLDYHKDMQSYAEAKALLFQHPGLENAVINFDDAFGRTLIEKAGRQLDVITYSVNGEKTPQHRFIAVSELNQQGAQGYRVKIKSAWGDGEFSSSLLGRFNIDNVLATLGVLLSNGMPLKVALTCCEKLRMVRGRMQVFGNEKQPKVVVDYSHTPDSLEKALTALREHCAGHLWCVFGCGGNRDKTKRPLMANIAEKCADHIIITDDNPRFESSKDIAADIIAGLQRPQQAFVILDRAEAIQTAVQNANDNDIVLIAGKGHEVTQIVGEQVLPFDDAEQVQRALHARSVNSTRGS